MTDQALQEYRRLIDDTRSAYEARLKEIERKLASLEEKYKDGKGSSGDPGHDTVL